MKESLLGSYNQPVLNMTHCQYKRFLKISVIKILYNLLCGCGVPFQALPVTCFMMASLYYWYYLHPVSIMVPESGFKQCRLQPKYVLMTAFIYTYTGSDIPVDLAYRRVQRFDRAAAHIWDVQIVINLALLWVGKPKSSGSVSPRHATVQWTYCWTPRCHKLHPLTSRSPGLL